MQLHLQGDSLKDDINTVLESVWNRQTKARKGFPLFHLFHQRHF